MSELSDIAHAPSRVGTGWGFAVMLLGMLAMMVPTFFSHFKAYLRGATRILDQPYDDVGSIIMKGLLWLAAVIGLGLTLLSADSNKKAEETK